MLSMPERAAMYGAVASGRTTTPSLASTGGRDSPRPGDVVPGGVSSDARAQVPRIVYQASAHEFKYLPNSRVRPAGSAVRS